MKIDLSGVREILRDVSSEPAALIEAAAVASGAAEATDADLRRCRALGGLPAEFVRSRLPACGCVALLEDDTRRVSEMSRALRRLLPDAELKVFVDSTTMIAWLGRHQSEVDLICLDHDLNDATDFAGSKRAAGTGRDVSRYLASVPPTCPIIVHSSNAIAAGDMVRELRNEGWPVSRVYPFDDVSWIAKEWAEEIKNLLRAGAVAIQPAAHAAGE